MIIFDLGYGLTAISYGLFLLLLLTVRNAGVARHFLLFATLITSAWALGHISYVDGNLGREKILVYDALRQFAWILFLAACLRADFPNIMRFLAHKNTLVACILPAFTIVIDITRILPGMSQFILHTVVAIQALVMTELVWRQAGESRWAFKPLIVFLAVLGLLDFVTYANALMLNTLSWDFFAARGYITFALLPFLFIAVRRIKHWGIEIFVSREVVLHSTLLLLAGIYLLIMAMLGYFVKYYGGDWNRSIQIALVIVSLIFLAALLLSHQIRTSIKVFITKHFYANQYDYRVEWVKLTKTLETVPSDIHEVYSNGLKGWLEGIGYSEGVLYKLKGAELELVASLPKQLPPLDHELIQQFKRFFDNKLWIIDVDELRVKPEVYEEIHDKSMVIQRCNKQLIVPLTRNDELWGFIAMSAEQPNKRSLNWELRDYINALSEQITSYILNAENSLALAENAQFAAFNRMSAFVVHDLKNVLAQINLIISNAEQHKSNPEFIDDTFETLTYTKERMDKMLRQLMQKSNDSERSIMEIELNALIKTLIDTKCQGMLPLPELQSETSVMLRINEDKISNVLYHLINNAQQATADNGKVLIKLSQSQQHVIISIEDTGCGMSEEFIRTRLFKPFETTKGNAGMGIGAYDAKTYIEEIGGKLSVNSAVGQGSIFEISLPKEE